MISHHFIMVIQVATKVAELADQEVGMETGAKDVVEVVVAGALLIHKGSRHNTSQARFAYGQ